MISICFGFVMASATLPRNKVVYILFSALVIRLAEGHSIYQQSIPNGEMVPHPCKPNFLWRGVGHENINGGGNRNPFGLDFEKNGKVWNKTLCEMDSDGDGKTNGLELGDPECIWTPKQKTTKTTGLSHPGICEPLGSERCKGKFDTVDCEHGEFKCPAVEDTENKAISMFTMRLRCTTARSRETSYVCQSFELPAEEHHMIAFKPIIDNALIVHHIVVFGCIGDFHGKSSPYYCGMVPHSACMDIIAVWSLGMSGHCMHKDCGILVGGDNGFKWAALQVHWNNPELLYGLKDSSGMIFYLTSKLRPFNAGILNIGQTKIAIPPGKEEYVERGTCDAKCTNTIMKDRITVVSVYNHMHYLGRAQTTELIKGTGSESRVVHLANDEIYNYDDPILHEFEDGVIVNPGDELKTTCVYKSTSRHNMTYFGDETNDEMCFSFLTYFPAENSQSTCLSMGERTICESFGAETCDRSRLDPTSPELLILLQKIQSLCTPGLCRNECMAFVRDMQEDPCFNELNNMRSYLIKVTDFDHHLNVIFAAFDSCNTELLLEKIVQQECRNGWLDLSQAAGRGWRHVYLETFALICLLVFL